MVTADIFVWETRNWGIRSGYVYSQRKAERIEDQLEKSEDVLWYRRFGVSGWNLYMHDLNNLNENDLS